MDDRIPLGDAHHHTFSSTSIKPTDVLDPSKREIVMDGIKKFLLDDPSHAELFNHPFFPAIDFSSADSGFMHREAPSRKRRIDAAQVTADQEPVAKLSPNHSAFCSMTTYSPLDSMGQGAEVAMDEHTNEWEHVQLTDCFPPLSDEDLIAWCSGLDLFNHTDEDFTDDRSSSSSCDGSSFQAAMTNDSSSCSPQDHTHEQSLSNGYHREDLVAGIQSTSASILPRKKSPQVKVAQIPFSLIEAMNPPSVDGVTAVAIPVPTASGRKKELFLTLKEDETTGIRRLNIQIVDLEKKVLGAMGSSDCLNFVRNKEIEKILVSIVSLLHKRGNVGNTNAADLRRNVKRISKWGSLTFYTLHPHWDEVRTKILLDVNMYSFQNQEVLNFREDIETERILEDIMHSEMNAIFSNM